MASMWEENQKLQQVKDQFLPGLIDNGLLRSDADGGNIYMVESWKEHQELLKMRKENSIQM